MKKIIIDKLIDLKAANRIANIEVVKRWLRIKYKITILPKSLINRCNNIGLKYK